MIGNKPPYIPKENKIYNLNIPTPFFRMNLIKPNFSKQHELLVDLEDDYPELVYYATPIMEDIDIFNAAYNSATVHEQSAFFSPGDIGYLTDNYQHSIAYRNDMSFGWFCSQPQEIPVYQFEKISERIDSHYLPLEETVSKIRESILSLIRDQESTILGFSEESFRQRIRERIHAPGLAQLVPNLVQEVFENMLVFQEISRVVLGLELIIFQQEKVE